MKERKLINPMKELRLELKKTQQVFAKEVNIGKSTVSHIESGKIGISAPVQKKIAVKYHLYNDWYQSRNYKPKPSFRDIEKMLYQYIKHNIKDEQIASDIFITLKEVININNLSGEEQKTYIRYINDIMKDVKNISEVAKLYISKQPILVSGEIAHKIFVDVMSLYGIKMDELIRPIRLEVSEPEELKFEQES
nr:helix-turn-helix transcriptional regulator [uncultured Anaerosporobacter sp.]